MEFGNPYYILLKCNPIDVIVCTLYLLTQTQASRANVARTGDESLVIQV